MKMQVRHVLYVMLAVALTVSMASASTIAYWKFNDAAPGETLPLGARIADSSGNNRDLYQTQTPFVFVYGDPRYGDGIALSRGTGGDKLLYEPGYDFGDGGPFAGSSFSVPYSQAITFEAYVRIPEGSPQAALLERERIDNQQIWWRVGTNGVQTLYWRYKTGPTSGAAVVAAGTTNLMDGQWHHIAAIKDFHEGQSRARVYVDYELDGENTDHRYDHFDTTGVMSIGSFVAAATSDFTGEIAFVRITHGALTPAEFVQPAAVPENPSPADGASPVPENPVLSWSPIDDGSTIASQTVVISKDPAMSVIEQALDGSGNTAAPSLLDKDTVYYWRVDTEFGDSTVRRGLVWSFATARCLLTAEDGDLNGDCIVNFEDIAIMASNWLLSIYEN